MTPVDKIFLLIAAGYAITFVVHYLLKIHIRRCLWKKPTHPDMKMPDLRIDPQKTYGDYRLKTQPWGRRNSKKKMTDKPNKSE